MSRYRCRECTLLRVDIPGDACAECRENMGGAVLIDDKPMTATEVLAQNKPRSIEEYFHALGAAIGAGKVNPPPTPNAPPSQYSPNDPMQGHQAGGCGSLGPPGGTLGGNSSSDPLPLGSGNLIPLTDRALRVIVGHDALDVRDFGAVPSDTCAKLAKAIDEAVFNACVFGTGWYAIDWEDLEL